MTSSPRSTLLRGLEEFLVAADARKEKFARRRVALKRYGDPEEVAHATLSLALPAASFINGAALVVDGGLLVRNA